MSKILFMWDHFRVIRAGSLPQPSWDVLGHVPGQLLAAGKTRDGQSHQVAAVTASNVNRERGRFTAAIRPDSAAVDGQIAQPAVRMAVVPLPGSLCRRRLRTGSAAWHG